MTDRAIADRFKTDRAVADLLYLFMSTNRKFLLVARFLKTGDAHVFYVRAYRWMYGTHGNVIQRKHFS